MVWIVPITENPLLGSRAGSVAKQMNISTSKRTDFHTKIGAWGLYKQPHVNSGKILLCEVKLDQVCLFFLTGCLNSVDFLIGAKGMWSCILTF